jgi:hypothetical protein
MGPPPTFAYGEAYMPTACTRFADVDAITERVVGRRGASAAVIRR